MADVFVFVLILALRRFLMKARFLSLTAFAALSLITVNALYAQFAPAATPGGLKAQQMTLSMKPTMPR